MTPQKIAIKWGLYSLVTLFFLFLQNMIFTHIVIWGIHPVILSALIAIPCIYESLQSDLIYALCFGLILDISIAEPFPCFYILSFSLCAIISYLFARHIIRPGFVCAVVCSGICLILLGFCHMFALLFSNPCSFIDGMFVIAREFLLSIFPVPVIFLCYRRVDLRMNHD